MAKNKTKTEEPVVRNGLDITKIEEPVKPVESKYPTVAEINEEFDREYGWCRKNIVDIARMILRELVIARLERRKNG